MDSERSVSPAPGRRRVRYLLPKGAVLGMNYEVVEPLGHGGMGEVYRVRHIKMDIYRAIKILLPKIVESNPEFAKNFMQEAKFAVQIEHPNIVNVIDADYDQRLNLYYFVMELVEGSSVRKLLRKDGPFPELKTIEIALYIGRVLEDANKKNIVHRDIKPDNIMLTNEGKVKLADLGIAKYVSDNDKSVTKGGCLIGTPAYISPEQAEDAQSVDCRADIYSLGVTLYEMLTGEKPYKGANSKEILEHVFMDPVPDVRKKIPAISRKTGQLVQKMMAKNRDDRPRDWTEVCSLFEEILGRTMTVRIKDTIAADVAAAELTKTQEGRMPAGIVMDAPPPFIETIKPKIGKIASLAAAGLVGCVLCVFLLMGLMSGSVGKHLQREFIMLCWGKEFRVECDEYKLTPPLRMTFASDSHKKAWIENNKPKSELGPIDIKSRDPNDKTPDTAEYKGVGTLTFTLNADPGLEQYLKDRKYPLTVSSKKTGTREISLPGELSNIPAGVYTLKFSLPECKELPEVEIDLKKNQRQEIKISAAPLDAKVRIKCNVPTFQVWWNHEWISAQELQVDSLKTTDIVVRSDGYKNFSQTIRLNPSEQRLVEAVLEPLPKTAQSDVEDLMKKADEAFQKRNYSTAKKLYLEAAEKGNPLANYRLGEIFEYYDEWVADLSKAYRYYRTAAELGYGPAIYKVGFFYENGLGNVRKDDVEALKWYRMGAEMEDVSCLNSIAKFYEKGLGKLASNIDSAITYYKRGAAKDDGESYFNLGRLYEQKMFSATSTDESIRYRKLARTSYEEALRRGMTEAKERMRNL